MIWVIIGIAVAVGLYFLLRKKKVVTSVEITFKAPENK